MLIVKFTNQNLPSVEPVYLLPKPWVEAETYGTPEYGEAQR